MVEISRITPSLKKNLTRLYCTLDSNACSISLCELATRQVFESIYPDIFGDVRRVWRRHLLYYYTTLISNRAVPGTVWNWRVGLGLGRLDRDDLELARELGLLVEDAREQLAGILVRGRVPRGEGLVGLVDDVVHCVCL